MKISIFTTKLSLSVCTIAREIWSKLQAKDQDRYGRTVADVILPDGRNLNREIVKAGFAWCYRKYAPRDAELEALESEARHAKRGLWVDPHPIPPWEYRALIRERRPR